MAISSIFTRKTAVQILVLAGVAALTAKAVFADPPPPAATPSPAAAAAAAAARKTLAAFAQDAVRVASEAIGLNPDEKKILETEVMAEPMPFVSNYRGSGESTDVQVDKEKLRGYLKFSPQLFGTGSIVCVKVKAAADCAACEALRAPIEQGFLVRMERRNFIAKTGPAIPEESNLAGERAFEDYLGRAQDPTAVTGSRCEGVIYGEILPERSADADDESEDQNVRASAYMLIKDLSGKKIRSRGSAVLQVSRALDATRAKQFVLPAIGRQTADLFAQAAGQASGSPSKIADEEHYLRLEGVQSYAAYSKFKQVVTGAMPELKLEERFISPGLFQFAVTGAIPFTELPKNLKGLNWDGQAIEVVRSSPEEIAVVLK